MKSTAKIVSFFITTAFLMLAFVGFANAQSSVVITEVGSFSTITISPTEITSVGFNATTSILSLAGVTFTGDVDTVIGTDTRLNTCGEFSCDLETFSTVNNSQYNHTFTLSGVSDGDYILFTSRGVSNHTFYDVIDNIYYYSAGQLASIPNYFPRSFVWFSVENETITEYAYIYGGTQPDETGELLFIQSENIFTFSSASEPLRLHLFAPADQTTASFTTPMLASVISGVQDTGTNIWPLFVVAGIPLAFIIGLQLIVFTRRAIMFRNDNKK